MQRTLNCAGRLLDFSTPRIMGIMNLTPDSFYDGGHLRTLDDALRRAEQFLLEGADILDVGGASSRPGAVAVGAQEELKRVVPVIEAISRRFPNAILSVDTTWAVVAKASVEVGASVINDISAGDDDETLLPTVAELGVPYVLMHKKGTPADMQFNPSYDDVVAEVSHFFVEKLALLRQLGIKDVLLDVGFGFGKTLEHNYQLLANLQAFQVFALPMLVGISRKSMIYKKLNINAENALNATTALHWAALERGGNLLRVHDVAAAKEVITLFKTLQSNDLKLDAL